MTILAIDPGDKQSAYCFIDSEDLRPLRFAKAENAEVLLVLQLEKYDLVVIDAFGKLWHAGWTQCF